MWTINHKYQDWNCLFEHYISNCMEIPLELEIIEARAELPYVKFMSEEEIFS